MSNSTSTPHDRLPFPPTIWFNDILNADDFFNEAMAQRKVSKRRYICYLIYRSAMRRLIEETLAEWQAEVESEWGIPTDPVGEA